MILLHGQLHPQLVVLPVQLYQLPVLFPVAGTSSSRHPQICRSEGLNDGLDGRVAEGEEPGAGGGEEDGGHLHAGPSLYFDGP